HLGAALRSRSDRRGPRPAFPALGPWLPDSTALPLALGLLATVRLDVPAGGDVEPHRTYEAISTADVAPAMNTARGRRKSRRARCARDLAVATVMFRQSAISAIDKPSTSRRMITARWWSDSSSSAKVRALRSSLSTAGSSSSVGQSTIGSA